MVGGGGGGTGAGLHTLAACLGQCSPRSFCVVDVIPSPFAPTTPEQLSSEPRSTCTACAGTLLLEFGTLSKLTGNHTYADLATRALEAIYCTEEEGGGPCLPAELCAHGGNEFPPPSPSRLQPSPPLAAAAARRSVLGLVGKTIDVDAGTWLGKTAGVGAGQDSYYEYLLKVCFQGGVVGKLAKACGGVGGGAGDGSVTVWRGSPV